ncbi:MAG: hypothetical protein M3Y60_02250 [Bacteroidota bacterium]|nr:hypothetical protein [Bacteroidota bacterium]
MINPYSVSRMEEKVDFSDFRTLLESLENSEVRIRVRLMGQGWTGYSNLILLSESAMILEDDSDQRTVLYLKNVIKFQVDREAFNVKPDITYEVIY